MDIKRETICNFYDESLKIKGEIVLFTEPTTFVKVEIEENVLLSQLTSQNEVKIENKEEGNLESVSSGYNDNDSDRFVNTTELENHPYSQLTSPNKVKFGCKDEADIEPVSSVDDISEVKASDYFVNTSDLSNYEEEIEYKGDTVVKTECLSYERKLPSLKQPSCKKTVKKKSYENNQKCPCPLCRKSKF